MENHHFSWVNQLSIAIFNRKLLVYQRVGRLATVQGFAAWPAPCRTFWAASTQLTLDEILAKPSGSEPSWSEIERNQPEILA